MPGESWQRMKQQSPLRVKTYRVDLEGFYHELLTQWSNSKDSRMIWWQRNPLVTVLLIRPSDGARHPGYTAQPYATDAGGRTALCFIRYVCFGLRVWLSFLDWSWKIHQRDGERRSFSRSLLFRCCFYLSIEGRILDLWPSPVSSWLCAFRTTERTASNCAICIYPCLNDLHREFLCAHHILYATVVLHTETHSSVPRPSP